MLVIIVFTVIFFVKLKTRMYLYFKDHRKKFGIQALGMLIFIAMYLVHVVRDIIKLSRKDHDYNWWLNTSNSLTINQALQEITEVIACLIIIAAKSDEDCFSCFNRNKAIHRYSSFQYDYLSRWKGSQDSYVKACREETIHADVRDFSMKKDSWYNNDIADNDDQLMNEMVFKAAGSVIMPGS